MASSLDQSHGYSTLHVSGGGAGGSSSISRVHSDTSVLSTTSFQSIPEAIPEQVPVNSLSPPQIEHLLASSPASTPNSPHLGSRPSSATKGKGSMRKKFHMRHRTTTTQPAGGASLTISPLSHPQPSTGSEDPLVAGHVSVHQANRALFTRMLRKGFQLPPKKISFRRPKRRMDKQYHSDDGYTSDPGAIREAVRLVSPALTSEQKEAMNDEYDDETDNDPDVHEMRRLTQIKELQGKITKAKRLVDMDEPSLDNEDYLEGPVEKPRLTLRLSRNVGKSKSFQEQRRRKIEKWEAQVKDLQEGGSQDSDPSRRAKLKGRIEGSLKGITHSGFMKGLTNAGSKFRRKRTAVPGEAMDDEDDEQLLEEDDMHAGGEEEGMLEGSAQTFEAEPEILVEDLREDLDALRMTVVSYGQEMKELKEKIHQHQDSLPLIVEKLNQERERGERLEGQLNDITELHQHEMSDLQAQLAQIENSTMVKGQELEEAVELFNSKFNKVDAHVMKLIDSSVEPGDMKQRIVRGPMVSLLSFLLVILAFILRMVSLIREKPLRHFILFAVISVLIGLWWSSVLPWPRLWTTPSEVPPSPSATPPTLDPDLT